MCLDYHTTFLPSALNLGDRLDLPENAPTLREGSRTARSGSSVTFFLLLADVDMFTVSDVRSGRPCEWSSEVRQKSIASGLSLHDFDLVGLNDFMWGSRPVPRQIAAPSPQTLTWIFLCQP
jgi:hypothetical protein